MSESSPSPLEAETLHETTAFEYFDRTWTVPARRRMSHMKRLNDALRRGTVSVDLLVAETYLGAEEFAALLVIDPDEEALDGFTSRIAEVMGLGVKGNS